MQPRLGIVVLSRKAEVVRNSLRDDLRFAEGQIAAAHTTFPDESFGDQVARIVIMIQRNYIGCKLFHTPARRKKAQDEEKKKAVGDKISDRCSVRRAYSCPPCMAISQSHF